MSGPPRGYCPCRSLSAIRCHASHLQVKDEFDNPLFADSEGHDGEGKGKGEGSKISPLYVESTPEV